MSAYRLWNKAEHQRRQAIVRFGQDSPQADRMRDVSRYWWEAWHAEGCPIGTPPDAETLEERIRTSEEMAREHRRAVERRP